MKKEYYNTIHQERDTHTQKHREREREINHIIQPYKQNNYVQFIDK